VIAPAATPAPGRIHISQPQARAARQPAKTARPSGGTAPRNPVAGLFAPGYLLGVEAWARLGD
jgi:hypothetical protein